MVPFLYFDIFWECTLEFSLWNRTDNYDTGHGTSHSVYQVVHHCKHAKSPKKFITYLIQVSNKYIIVIGLWLVL